MSKSRKVWFPGPGWQLPSANKPVANHPWPMLRGLEHRANEAKVKLGLSRAGITGRRSPSHSLSLQPLPVQLGLGGRPGEGCGPVRVWASLCPQPPRGPELVHLPVAVQGMELSTFLHARLARYLVGKHWRARKCQAGGHEATELVF